jgi:hypothetical protein
MPYLAIVIPGLTRNQGAGKSNPVLSLHEPPFWIPAGVYPREGGAGNDVEETGEVWNNIFNVNLFMSFTIKLYSN